MNRIKKDRTPAKGYSLIIGNRVLNGLLNVRNRCTDNKVLQAEHEARVLAEMLHTLQSGFNTYCKVLEATEAKYQPFHVDVFRNEYSNTLHFLYELDKVIGGMK